MLTVRIKTAGVDDVDRELSELSADFKDALAAGLNQALEDLRPKVAAAIAEQLNLPLPTIAGYISLSRRGGGQGSIDIAAAPPVSLYAFDPLPRFPGKNERPGVSVEMRRGRRQTIPQSFIQDANQGVGVFQRVSRTRNPVRKLYGLGPADIYNDASTGVATKIEADASELLEAEIDSRIDALLPEGG